MANPDNPLGDIKIHISRLGGEDDPIQNVPDDLERMAELFRERNATYGSNYLDVGRIMEILFPNGIALKTAADHNRFHLFMLKIVKLTRYSKNYEEGGHQDSIEDDIVYTAMVAALDRAARDNAG